MWYGIYIMPITVWSVFILIGSRGYESSQSISRITTETDWFLKVALCSVKLSWFFGPVLSDVSNGTYDENIYRISNNPIHVCYL